MRVVSNNLQGKPATGKAQYLTFLLGTGIYGIGILNVQEIKGLVPVVRTPSSPPHLMGVLNLRGCVVPIMDLRSRLGLEAQEYDAFAAIIVAISHGTVMGLIVDRVSEVITIDSQDIHPPAEVSGKQFMSGMGKCGDDLIILLDIGMVMENTSIAA